MSTIYSRIFLYEYSALKKEDSFFNDERVSLSNLSVSKDSIPKKLNKGQKTKLHFSTMIKIAKLELLYAKRWGNYYLCILKINKSEGLFLTIFMTKIMLLYKNLSRS